MGGAMHVGGVRSGVHFGAALVTVTMQLFQLLAASPTHKATSCVPIPTIGRAALDRGGVVAVISRVARYVNAEHASKLPLSSTWGAKRVVFGPFRLD